MTVSPFVVNLDNPSHLFGKKLHEQVEDRLKFYDTGEAPKKNIDAMKEVLDAMVLAKSAMEGGIDEGDKKKKKKKKDRKSLQPEEKEEMKAEVATTPVVKVDIGEEAPSTQKKKKKKKIRVEGELLMLQFLY